MGSGTPPYEAFLLPVSKDNNVLCGNVPHIVYTVTAEYQSIQQVPPFPLVQLSPSPLCRLRTYRRLRHVISCGKFGLSFFFQILFFFSKVLLIFRGHVVSSVVSHVALDIALSLSLSLSVALTRVPHECVLRQIKTVFIFVAVSVRFVFSFDVFILWQLGQRFTLLSPASRSETNFENFFLFSLFRLGTQREEKRMRCDAMRCD